jgi:hypothetical protein
MTDDELMHKGRTVDIRAPGSVTCPWYKEYRKMEGSSEDK